MNRFSDDLIESFYKLTTENEDEIFSILEEHYKVVNRNSVTWLIKDVYQYNYLVDRSYKTVLNEQVILNITFIQSTDLPFYSKEINESDMIENWNQAEKAF
ncbi:hypothetical protein, partial [Aliikangiella maris]